MVSRRVLLHGLVVTQPIGNFVIQSWQIEVLNLRLRVELVGRKVFALLLVGAIYFLPRFQFRILYAILVLVYLRSTFNRRILFFIIRFLISVEICQSVPCLITGPKSVMAVQTSWFIEAKFLLGRILFRKVIVSSPRVWLFLILLFSCVQFLFSLDWNIFGIRKVLLMRAGLHTRPRLFQSKFWGSFFFLSLFFICRILFVDWVLTLLVTLLLSYLCCCVFISNCLHAVISLANLCVCI